MNRLLAVAVIVFPVLAFGQTSPAEVAQKFDSQWAHRDDPKVVTELDALLTEAIKANPNDYGLLWRSAKLGYWVADGKTGEQKKNLGKACWDMADRAVKANPSGTEGVYFSGLCIGAYSQGAGILKALSEGLEGKFNERIDASMKNAPDIDSAGPFVAKGRYWYELPWPKRSLDKSSQMLQKALEKHPENLRARMYLAETQLKDGDAKKAKETLAPVLTGDVSYDPPEGKRVQALAKGVEAKIEEELK